MRMGRPETHESDAPADRLAWRPQTPGRSDRPRHVRDSIVEPHWQGLHVLAHFEAGELALIDAQGEEADDIDSLVTEALSAAVMAEDAVIDGFLTPEATRNDVGAAPIASTNTSGIGLLVGSKESGRLDVAPVRRADRDAAAGGELAFVAVDLLRLDGQSLLDIPLLERKRLLESLLVQSERVRISPYTRPPVEQWLASWKSLGFQGVVVKAANSRYRPNSASDEWTVVTRLGRA